MRQNTILVGLLVLALVLALVYISYRMSTSYVEQFQTGLDQYASTDQLGYNTDIFPADQSNITASISQLSRIAQQKSGVATKNTR